MFHFNNKEFPSRQVAIDGAVYNVSTESLANELFTDDSRTDYTNDEARLIDEDIFFYVPDDVIDMPIIDLQDYVEKQVN
jgi:hypothetical protein